MRVILPLVEYQVKKRSLAKRPPTLDGKVVAFTDAWAYRQADGSQVMYPLMAELKKLLEKRFKLAGTLWFVKVKPTVPLSPDVIQEIEKKADVVINGECWGGGETVTITNDAVELEKMGKPTITIAQQTMHKLVLAFCAAAGMPDLPFLVEPNPDRGNMAADAAGIAKANIEHVVSSLTA
jgi:hypothetical protein